MFTGRPSACTIWTGKLPATNMRMISRVSDPVGVRVNMVGVRGGLDMKWDSEGDRVAGGFCWVLGSS